jgi:hypothetical protein
MKLNDCRSMRSVAKRSSNIGPQTGVPESTLLALFGLVSNDLIDARRRRQAS